MRYLPFLLAAACFAGEPGPQALMDSGHFKRARAMVEQSYRANPRDPETLWLMSRLKQEWRDYEAALDFAEKALAADPKNARYHLRVADAAGDLAQRANVLKQFGLGRRFKKEVDETLALDPNNPEALSMLMGFYVMAPGVMGGDKAKAQTIPARIMQIDPVQGIFAQLDLAGMLKEKVDPEALYRKAVEARPSSFEAHARLAGYYCRTNVKRYAEAETQAREAIRLDPGRAGARNTLAAALVEEKKWAELDAALADSERAIPDDLAPYCVAGFRCVLGSVELPRAENYFRKYLTQEPEAGESTLANAHRLLGGALYKEGRKADAIDDDQKLLAECPQYPGKPQVEAELKDLTRTEPDASPK